MGCRSIETYVRMGDQVGVQPDMPDATPPPTVPDHVETDTADLLTTWKRLESRRAEQTALISIDQDSRDLDGDASVSGRTDGLPDTSTPSAWELLRQSEAWKDHVRLWLLSFHTSSEVVDI
jgi:hypothetical protein